MEEPDRLWSLALIICIVDFLNNDTNGIAYVQTKGGVNTALQDFIAPGIGLNAERVLFIIAVIAVLFEGINGTREIVKEASIYRRERTVNLGIIPSRGATRRQAKNVHIG